MKMRNEGRKELECWTHPQGGGENGGEGKRMRSGRDQRKKGRGKGKGGVRRMGKREGEGMGQGKWQLVYSHYFSKSGSVNNKSGSGNSSPLAIKNMKFNMESI